MELGPFPTRELFPLFLPTMAYEPVDPTPLGRGRWRFSLEQVEANTFEFSDVFKAQAPRDASGRLLITRAFVEAHAAEYANLPLVFFFDGEIARTTLRARVGLTDETDLWVELPIQSYTRGYLDPLIESVHSLGFEQYGRDRVLKNQLTFVVMSRGVLQFYSDEPQRAKSQDPTLGFSQRLLATSTWTLSGYAMVKPPLTMMYGRYQSGWDTGVGLTARWQGSPNHVFYLGGGVVTRPSGSGAYEAMAFGRMRDGWGAHATWEYRSGTRLRPYVQLYAQSGYLPAQPSQKLDRWSLQHDIGVHWQLAPRTTLTFRYLNNITHNENTADMGLGVCLSVGM
jgi:hypothetical protein